MFKYAEKNAYMNIRNREEIWCFNTGSKIIAKIFLKKCIVSWILMFYTKCLMCFFQFPIYLFRFIYYINISISDINKE
jgi:hypothetical protein